MPLTDSQKEWLHKYIKGFFETMTKEQALEELDRQLMGTLELQRLAMKRLVEGTIQPAYWADSFERNKAHGEKLMAKIQEIKDSNENQVTIWVGGDRYR